MVNRVLLLLLGLGSVGLFLVGAHLLSDRFSLIERNRRSGIEADAYFYSEVGDLREFLDDENGRYGVRSLRRLGKGATFSGESGDGKPGLLIRK